MSFFPICVTGGITPPSEDEVAYDLGFANNDALQPSINVDAPDPTTGSSPSVTLNITNPLPSDIIIVDIQFSLPSIDVTDSTNYGGWILASRQGIMTVDAGANGFRSSHKEQAFIAEGGAMTSVLEGWYETFRMELAGGASAVVDIFDFLVIQSDGVSPPATVDLSSSGYSPGLGNTVAVTGWKKQV